MTLKYETDKRLQGLIAVVDEYTEWFMQVVRRISYPLKGKNGKQFSMPDSFILWADEAQRFMTASEDGTSDYNCVGIWSPACSSAWAISMKICAARLKN